MFSQSTSSKDFDSSKETFILSLGLLGELNHMATGMAFIKLGAQPGKMQEGAKLGPAEIQPALPAILALDGKLKSETISPADFRAGVIQILKLKAATETDPSGVTDAEFDAAWNAMLGDVKKMIEQLEALKKQNPDSNFILVSASSSIHINYILNTANSDAEPEKASNPLFLNQTPLYVSYLSQAYKENTTNKSLFEEVFKTYKPQINKTIVIINPESNTYADVKKRDEANAASVKRWAELIGLTVLERLGKNSVLDTVANFKTPAVAVGLAAQQ